MENVACRSLPLRAALCGVALTLLVGPPLPAQRDFGRTTYSLGERTTAGSWHGTWIYRSRDQQMAIWLRDVDGAPQLKLRIMMKATAETFETGWDGSAEYEFKDKPGTFKLDFESADPDQIRGSWHWLAEKADGDREEIGEFRMFRIDSGRTLAIEFDSFEEIIRRGEQELRRPSIRVLTFTKVSRRHANWDELPF